MSRRPAYAVERFGCLSAQIPISDWSKGSAPMRRSVRHCLRRQRNSHAATCNQLPCFGV